MKIRPGVTVDQVNAKLQAILEQFAKQSPERFPDSFRVNLRSITSCCGREVRSGNLNLLCGQPWEPGGAGSCGNS